MAATASIVSMSELVAVPLVSFVSCYHFGYHWEHHVAPHVPWWRLPEARRNTIVPHRV